MELSDIKRISSYYQNRAIQILENTKIIGILEDRGLRVNLIGSLKMGLMVNHRDIDLHVYSKNITVESSFQVIAKIASNPNVIETLCVNGLNTDEHCMEWHLKYKDEGNEIWQIDIIHIEEGSQYDGYFEKMADKLCEIMTPYQRDVILKLKYLSSFDTDIHGSEIYEAVIDYNISELHELKEWVEQRRLGNPYFWIPK